jgi:four helix bundle protein
MEVPRERGGISRMGTEAGRHGADRLRVYHLALQWAAAIQQLVASLDVRPALLDQLLRAVDSVVLNIAEGASHHLVGRKVYHYRVALASAGEAKAALARLRPANPDADLHMLTRKADMIIVMLTSLVRTFESRD